MDRAEFSAAVRSSELCSTAALNEAVNEANVDSLFNTYDKVLRELADKFAPAGVTKSIRCQRIAVWFDDERRKLCRHSRMLERCFRKT